MIEVQKLSKYYGDFQAINEVDFSIEKGEVLGLLGPNGAGKTTIMKILTCFMPATSGTATVDGDDVFESSLEVRKKIGYLPEHTPLYTDMMVKEYLMFIAELREIPSKKRRNVISEKIDMCNLKDVLTKDIGELSKGYRQRVCLAQALMHDPKILILDEPTSGLDPKQILGIRELIKNLGKEKTIILSTHILPEVSATCSRVLIINNGKIVATGTPEELQKNSSGFETIYTKIKAPKDDVKKIFTELDFIKDFKCDKTDAENINFYTLKTPKGSSVTEDIFNIVVKNKWSLTELKQESVSLEDVFLELTTKE
jgi:ABC-2 type transport system ATP-binding protein